MEDPELTPEGSFVIPAATAPVRKRRPSATTRKVVTEKNSTTSTTPPIIVRQAEEESKKEERVDEEEDESSEEEEEESSEEEEGSSEEEDSSDDDDDEGGTKPRRVSYSKELLKPTKEGNIIQAGADLQAASESEKHTPDYIHKQLKATGLADKLKKGEIVPNTSSAQSEDPNAKLGEMYKSLNLKKADPTAVAKKKATNSTTTPAYASMKLKKSEPVATTKKEETTSTKTPAYASVHLKKAEPMAVNKKKETRRSSLPEIRLNKAAPIAPAEKKETKQPSFAEIKLNKTALPIAKVPSNSKLSELPQEFCQAKQNLKRRTERPWYSNGVPEAQPSKQWFFQRGEWSDGSTPAPKQPSNSWFFGSHSKKSPPPLPRHSPNNHNEPGADVYRGSKTRVTTGKDLVHVQHFNELSPTANNEQHHKELLKKTKKYNKQYYQDLERRRKGLPPRRRRSGLFCTLFVWGTIAVLELGVALFCLHLAFPGEVHAAWKQVVQPQVVQPVLDQMRPHVRHAVENTVLPLVETVQPHLSAAFEQIQPHVVALDAKVRPPVMTAVDRVCTFVEDYQVSDDKKKWVVEPVQGAAVTVCAVMRTHLDVGIPTDSDSIHPADEPVATRSRHSPKKREAPGKATTNKSNNDEADECECDSSKKGPPKWVQRLIPGKKVGRPECCNRQEHTGEAEKDL